MERIRNLQQNEEGLEAEVYFPLFQKYIPLYGDTTVEYATACATYLNELPESVHDALCAASIRYCNEFLDYIGEPLRAFSHPRDVLALIQHSA